MDAFRIEVSSERGPYPVIVGAGCLASLPAALEESGARGATVIVSCAPVWRHLARRLRSLPAAKSPILIPDGERAKTLATVSRIYEALIKRRLDRSATLIAVGGGVVGDVAGFAGATFLRGLRVVHVPTTLLAQVDSAIGGKVGVNLEAGKNLVGSFHPPAMVACDPTTLKTLPPREFRSGFYEVVKYGVIASRPLFDGVCDRLTSLLDQDLDALSPTIAECCRIKADVVGRDEREGGLRRILNFGHTVGHALEALTGYRRFRHGEAIGYGMLAAARLSAMRGLFSVDDEAQLHDVIRRLGKLPPVADLRIPAALRAIQLDKKVDRGTLNFVLAKGIGATSIVRDVTTDELTAAMRSIGMAAR